MDDTTQFTQAVDKGRLFLARENFILAKQFFESALRMREDPQIQAAITQCERGLIGIKRKEAIKKGRRLEQKNKFGEALSCFEQANTWEEEPWLTDKITLLRQKQTLVEMTNQLRASEQSNDLETKLAAYDQALALGPNTSTINGKAAVLLQAHTPAEVIVLYTTHPPSNDYGRYLLGLAHAQQHCFGAAMSWWEQITDIHPPWLEQWRGLIPFAYRELLNLPAGSHHMATCRLIDRLHTPQSQPDLTRYAEFFKIKAMETWWHAGMPDQHEAWLQPDPRTIPWLGCYAQIYFKLAHQDVRHLEIAIPLWLTAIYQDSLLENLAVHQLQATPIHTQELRNRLQDAMERLISSCERTDTLPPGIRALWQIEKKSIAALTRFPPAPESFTIFPCTPDFANRFGLATQIQEILRQHRTLMNDEGDWFQELSASFSPAGPALLWLERGDETRALALIPPTAKDEQANYCRWRVAWATAVKILKEGKKGARKWLMIARPLLQTSPVYQETLIQLAFTNLEANAIIELEEIMTLLVENIPSAKFREATAHLIGIKVLQLMHTKQTPRNLETLLNQADKLHPNTGMVKNARAYLHKKVTYDQLDAALHKQNLTKAVQIASQTDDQKIRNHFFGAMEAFAASIMDWEKSEQVALYREFYTHCRNLDPNHPVTLSIGKQLEQLQAK